MSLRDTPGWVALPPLVDAHVHLDKTLFGSPWIPHRGSGTVADRVRVEEQTLAEHPDSIAVRASRLLERLSSRGISGIRSHVDVTDVTGLRNLEAVLALREEWSDRLTMDVVAFPQRGILRQDSVVGLLRDAIARGADTVGGLDPTDFDGDLARHLDVVFSLAAETGSRVDIHLHEPGQTGDAALAAIAERTADLGLSGRVVVSHAFCLADLEPAALAVTADRLASAGVGIHTSLPQLGVIPPVPMLLAAGVNVAVVSDNIRDSWSPYGRGDPLERACLAGYLFGWNTDAALERALSLVTSAPSRSLGLAVADPGRGTAYSGRDTDLDPFLDYVLVRADSIGEAIVDQPGKRIVVRAGRVVAGQQYAETL
jgi:cytosine deaminase